MTTTTPTTSAMREYLMTSVIERVELLLSKPGVMNDLLARGYSYTEARQRLIDSTFARLCKEAAI
jgi:hypothetical protein